MKSSIRTIILNFSVCSILFSQQITPAVALDSLVNDISSGSLSGPFLGMMGNGMHSSTQYTRYKLLAASATTEQLISLTNHVSPVVRCYAFRALLERNYPDLFHLLQAHLSDSAAVTEHSFDMIIPMTVGGYLESTILARYLVNLQPTSDSMYRSLRPFAESHKYPWALVSIARYRRSQDTTLILSYHDEGYNSLFFYLAVAEFPSPAFFDTLKQSFHRKLRDDSPLGPKNLEEQYYALVQYKTNESLALLREALELSQGKEYSRHRLSIYQALEKYPSHFYDDVRSEIRLTEFERHTVELRHQIEE